MSCARVIRSWLRCLQSKAIASSYPERRSCANSALSLVCRNLVRLAPREGMRMLAGDRRTTPLSLMTCLISRKAMTSMKRATNRLRNQILIVRTSSGFIRELVGRGRMLVVLAVSGGLVEAGGVVVVGGGLVVRGRVHRRVAVTVSSSL